MPVHTWLQVIPQLIARIHFTHVKIRQLLYGLLLEIGLSHPQALIFPLTVATKSDQGQRDALNILNKLRRQKFVLVQQAGM